MFIAAINTLQIQATAHNAESLAGHLTEIVETLKETPQCLGYTLTRSHANPQTLIVAGYWPSVAAMDAHFNHPVLNDLMGLFHCDMVRGGQFSRFIAS
ncbi:MAG: putative quinol monooxygenase [Pseudomonas sp.]